MNGTSGRRPAALVVYESMFGNTRAIAEAIADGLSATMDVTAVPVAEVRPEQLTAADLLVAGAPVHTWTLSRPSTRKAAFETAHKPGSGLSMEPGSDLPGMREWLAGLDAVTARFAAFDTRMVAPLGLSGSAARKIARGLRRAGLEPAAPRQFFRVTRHNELIAGELDRARRWGQRLATTETGLPTTTTGQSK